MKFEIELNLDAILADCEYDELAQMIMDHLRDFNEIEKDIRILCDMACWITSDIYLLDSVLRENPKLREHLVMAQSQLQAILENKNENVSE